MQPFFLFHKERSGVHPPSLPSPPPPPTCAEQACLELDACPGCQQGATQAAPRVADRPHPLVETSTPVYFVTGDTRAYFTIGDRPQMGEGDCVMAELVHNDQVFSPKKHTLAFM